MLSLMPTPRSGPVTGAWLALLSLASCEKVDPNARVLAKNVIVESTSRSSLQSSDAQSALEELSLVLAITMVGTWDITNKNIETEHSATGRVRIEADGGFALESGSFAAIGEGSQGFCSHVAGSERYEIITPRLIAFRHVNGTTTNSAIPRLDELRQNDITFVGGGGCGLGGLDRVSLLHRVAGP